MMESGDEEDVPISRSVNSGLPRGFELGELITFVPHAYCGDVLDTFMDMNLWSTTRKRYLGQV